MKDTGNVKSDLLQQEIQHIDITSFDARPIIDAMGKMTFTSRDTARAADIFNDDAEGRELLDPG